MKLLTRDHLLTILQTRTQKEAAKYLGIGERTIRRIKNEPGHKTIPRVAEAIKEKGYAARKKIRKVTLRGEVRKARRSIESEGWDSDLPAKPRGDYKYDLPDLPVVPPSERSTILDGRDRTLKTRMWGKAIIYNVKKISTADIFNLITWYRNRPGYAYRLVYQVPKGGNSIGGGRYPKSGHSGTTWESVSGHPDSPDSALTDTEIWEAMNAALNCYPAQRDRGRHNIQYLYIMGETFHRKQKQTRAAKPKKK